MAYATPQDDPNNPSSLDAPVILAADAPPAVGSTPSTSTVMDSGGANPTVDGASTVKDSSSGSVQMQPWSSDAQSLVGNTSTPTQKATYSSSSSPDWGAALNNSNASFGGEQVTPDAPAQPDGSTSSGAFKNISKYLNANSGTGVDKMASDQASSVIGGAQNDIGAQNDSFNNAVQNGSTVSGTYSGPASFTGSTQGQQSLADTQLANQEGSLANTAGGRTALLNQATSATPMTQGGTALDQFLLQMNQPAMSSLKSASDTSGLNSQFNANQTAGNAAATTAQNTATDQATANTAAANKAAQDAQTAAINDTLNKQAAAQQALYAQQTASQQAAYQQQIDAATTAQKTTADQLLAMQQAQTDSQKSQADQLAALLAQISASNVAKTATDPTVTPGGGTTGTVPSTSVPAPSTGGLMQPTNSGSSSSSSSMANQNSDGNGGTNPSSPNYMTGDANGSPTAGGLAQLGLGLIGMVVAPGVGSLVNAISAINNYVNNTPAPTAVQQPIADSPYASYTGDNTQGYTTGQTTPAVDPAAAQAQAQAEAQAQAQAQAEAQAQAQAQAEAQAAANSEGDTGGGGESSSSSESSSSEGGSSSGGG